VPTEVIGRDAELAMVEAFLDRPSEASSALILEGEAGIGKSTLWSAAEAAGRRRFAHVFASQPAESERSLANVVLGDLFGQVPPAIVAGLPNPRRRALENALFVGEAYDTAVDPHALAAAVLTLLTSLVADGPLLLAIDDDQWADASSVSSLAFALRRLRRAPIRLLLARRLDEGPGALPSREHTLDGVVEPWQVERIRVGPLSMGAIQLLIRTRLGMTMSRPNLVRLSEASGGNPFFALELARAQPASGSAAPLVVPPTLERLLAGRLDELDDATRRALLLIAAHGRGPLDLLQRLQVEASILDPARARRLVETSGGVVRFTHPLLASTVYQLANAAERHAAHLALASVADDPIGRARHLALGTRDPDEVVAAELESAATIARSRGLPVVSAELAEHSGRLTPAGRVGDALRRGRLAARASLEAGESFRARAIISTLLAESPRGRQRAEALVLGSELEEPGPAVVLLEEALREATGAREVRAAIHVRLGGVGRLVKGRAWAERHARAGLRLAQRQTDGPLEVRALSVLAVLRFEDADPAALDLAHEAQRRGAALADPEATRIATWALGHALMWLHRHEEARAWLEGALAEAAEQDELLRAECLWYLAMVELWSGRWQIAWEYAQQAAEIHSQYGIEQPQDHMPQALIALHQGQLGLAREHSTRALALAEGMLLPVHTAVLAIADLWSGRPEDALEQFTVVEELETRRGVHEPGAFFERADHVEALLRVGRIEDAERLAAEWEDATGRGGGEWMIADVLRSKGLIAAARGHLDDAARLLEAAVSRHEVTGNPFGRGRALLGLGSVRRRQRQKRRARAALEDARDAFVALGAASFADAAQRELGQLGGRRRLEGLSPSERRVAELVAEGRSNREVAATLFLAERTVASHLTHVYAKLGVRSRTELTRRLASDQPASDLGVPSR
jgi:DNA-binding CsgD family transcriptional regulator/tetratricopeptide (TPR) repeat protein